MAVDVGTGSIATFAESGAPDLKITSFNLDGQEKVVVDSSDMSTTGFRKKVFGRLTEPGALSMNINFDPEDPPVLGDWGAITVTFPSGATLSGTGQITSFTMDDPMEELITGTVVFSFDGQTGPTWG